MSLVLDSYVIEKRFSYYLVFLKNFETHIEGNGVILQWDYNGFVMGLRWVDTEISEFMNNRYKGIK